MATHDSRYNYTVETFSLIILAMHISVFVSLFYRGFLYENFF